MIKRGKCVLQLSATASSHSQHCSCLQVLGTGRTPHSIKLRFLNAPAASIEDQEMAGGAKGASQEGAEGGSQEGAEDISGGDSAQAMEVR